LKFDYFGVLLGWALEVKSMWDEPPSVNIDFPLSLTWLLLSTTSQLASLVDPTTFLTTLGCWQKKIQNLKLLGGFKGLTNYSGINKKPHNSHYIKQILKKWFKHKMVLM
jgi:hypothetical protein